MTESPSRRRLAENEVVFRSYNEHTQRDVDAIRRLANEEGHDDLAPADDLVLQFYCECSDEDCRLRVPVNVNDYKHIHVNRTQFVVVAGHDTPAIERVVAKRADYWIVEKFVRPPEDATQLHKTDVKHV